MFVVGGSAEVETSVGCSAAGDEAMIGVAAGAAGVAAARIATAGGTPPAVAGILARASDSLKVRSRCLRTTSFPEMAITVKSRMRSPTPTT
jgi:hypothetical protein